MLLNRIWHSELQKFGFLNKPQRWTSS